MKIKEVYDFLDALAPFNTACKWDNCGLLVGSLDEDLTNGLISLDITENVVNEAVQKECNLIISHHPLIFGGINKVTSDMLVYKIIKNKINVISVHTNLDKAKNGVNFALSQKLKFSNLRCLKTENESYVFKLVVFAPIEYEDTVKNSIFEAGGGIQGNYTECAFSSKGEGCFKATEKARPFIGSINKVERVKEVKIEVLIDPKKIGAVVDNMINNHPYEEPAYEVYKIYSPGGWTSLGLIGKSDMEYSPKRFAEFVKNSLGCKKVSFISGNRTIRSVAVCSGSGSDMIRYVISNNIDAFVTSEIKHSTWINCKNLGITLIDAGHFHTENVIVPKLTVSLNQHFKNNLFIESQNSIDPVEVL